MTLNAENIKELTVGTIVFVAKGFNVPERYQYMGLHGEHMIFSTMLGSGFSIYIKNPKHNYDLKSGNITTTYEECCERQRIQCINIIDHYNRHQLKDTPIIISESDRQFIYKY